MAYTESAVSTNRGRMETALEKIEYVLRNYKGTSETDRKETNRIIGDAADILLAVAKSTR